MATIGELILSLRGDSKDWTTAVGTAETSLKQLVREAEKAGQDLNKFNAQSINLLSGWKNEVGDAYRTFASSLEPVKQGLVDQGKALSINQEGINTLALGELNAAEKGKIFEKQLNFISSKLWVVTMGLQQMGVALTAAFTVPLAGLAALSTKTFADWETGTKNLQASADMTSTEVNAMTESFRQLALVMPLTTKELLQIAQTAAEAGVSSQGLEAYTIAIGKLVTISKELNLKTAAEALVSVSKAFGIAEDNVERVGSVIRKMAKESRGGMDDFTAALLRTTPAAATLSLKFEDVAAMLAAIIPVSGTATRAGTELSTMFDQMTANLPKLAGQMGITQEKLTNMINKDAVGALQTYIKQLGVSTNQVERNAAILEVFGGTGAKALRALISQYDVFLERQDESKQAFIDGTELTKDYNIASDTLANTFKRFQNAVLEVAKVIGDDLNSVIGPILEKAIKVVSTLAAVWVGLPKPIKEAAIALAAFLAVLGPLVLLFNTLISPIIGFITVLSKAVALFGAFSAAGTATAVTVAGVTTSIGALVTGIGEFLLIAAAVVAAVVLIYKALDKLFNITDKIKSALGLKGVEDRFAEIQKKIAGSLGAIGGTAEEAAKKVKDSLTGMSILAMEWGDNVMLSFLKGFTQADFGILNDNLKVFESYFQILEKQGKLTTEQLLTNTLEARRALAAAISEAKQFGAVSTDTQKRITALVGSARTKDITGQILAEVKVTQIQDTIDALNEEIKNRKDSLKQETDIIDDAVKDTKNKYKTQIDVQQDLIDALTKRKKDLEKAYKAEVRTLEATVEGAKNERDVAKDRLEAIKDSNRIFIDNLQSQKDALQENVDATKETLQELDDLRKDETDAASGMLDYAKMNLESARNQLKKEEALGHDEYDATYRAALERTNSGEKQVDLAYANYIKTKQLYTKEEKTLKTQLKSEQSAVDTIDDQLKAVKKTADEQEKLYQAQVDAAETTLDAAQKVMEVYKDAYSNQSDALQEQIDIHKEMVDDLQSARDKIVDKLTDERDALTDKYDAETRILESRVNNAQKSLDSSKKLLEAQKGINDQWLAIEKERIAAAQALTGGTSFGGIAAGDVTGTTEGLDAINAKLDETQSKLDNLKTNAPSIFENIGKAWKSGSWIDDFNKSLNSFDPAGSIGKLIRETDWGKLFSDIGTGIKNAFLSIDWQGIWDGLKLAVTKIDWLKLTDTILQIMFPPYFFLRVVLSAFGIDWEQIKNWLIQTVSSIDWGAVGLSILGAIFPPLGLLIYITKAFNIDWGKVKDDIVNFVKGIDWSEIGKTILGLLFPPYGIFLVLTNVFNIDWEKVKNDLASFVGQIDWGLVGRTILGALFAGPIAIGNLGSQIYNSIVSGLQNLGPDLQNIGTWIGQQIASGVSGTKDFFKNAAGAIGGLWDGVNEKWSSVWDLGKQIGSQLSSGVGGAWDNMKNAAKNIAGAIGSGLNEMWDTIKSWGTTTGNNFANGIYGVWYTVKDAARNIIGAVASGINEMWDQIKGWGQSIGTHLADGIYAAYDAIKNSASWIANVFKSFLGWFSPPETGPMSTGDKWMPNMIKTMTAGIMNTMPTLQGAIDTVGNTIMGIQDANPQPVIGTEFAAGTDAYAQGVASPALALAPANGGQPGGGQQVININPGMMIASKGEIRSFVRLLEGYSATERTRTGA